MRKELTDWLYSQWELPKEFLNPRAVMRGKKFFVVVYTCDGDDQCKVPMWFKIPVKYRGEAHLQTHLDDCIQEFKLIWAHRDFLLNL